MESGDEEVIDDGKPDIVVLDSKEKQSRRSFTRRNGICQVRLLTSYNFFSIECVYFIFVGFLWSLHNVCYKVIGSDRYWKSWKLYKKLKNVDECSTLGTDEIGIKKGFNNPAALFITDEDYHNQIETLRLCTSSFSIVSPSLRILTLSSFADSTFRVISVVSAFSDAPIAI